MTDPDEVVSGTTTWQWERSSDGNANWTDVGTDSPSYTPVYGDVTYYLRATASYTDGHGPNKSDEASTTSAVQSGTNRPPDFGATTTTRDVDENTASGQSVGAAVTADDPDPNDSLTYSLEGTDANSFQIDSSSGQIQTKSGVNYDHETKPSYSVTVRVVDDNQVTNTIDVTINVTDVNEPPEFPSTETGDRSIPENTGTGQVIGDPVEAEDPDTGDTLIYALSGTDAASFDIDTSTGQLKTEAALDKETKSSYSATVEVRDRPTDTNPDATIGVTITVTDVNEKPTFNDGAPATRSIAENSATDANIGPPVAATDPDTGDTLTYTLGGTDSASFSIDGTSGQLKTKAALNREEKASYTVTVSVHDGKNEAGGSDTTVDDTITVTITVTDANEPPTITGTSNVSYAENRTDAVATYTATDPEGSTNITWSKSGDDAGDFSISNAGVLTFVSPPNFEAAVDDDTDNVYLVTVAADDGEGNTASVDVTVTVTDVNEEPEFPSTETGARNIPENSAAAQSIGDPVEADDPENDTLTYSLGGTDASSFDIDTLSGQLKTKAALNKEAKASYQVTVSVRDSKNEAGTTDNADDDTITVTITVTDANDAPQFSAASITRTVRENTGAGQTVGRPVTATDGDNDTLTYSLEGTDKDSFTIVPGTGQIQTKLGVTYDHEATPSYSVTVKADDKNGGTATKDVTINVTDVNEPPLKPDKPTVSRESSNSVSVTWTAPDNAGRPPILHYQYQYKKTSEQLGSGEPFSTSGPTTSDTISTLDAGTSYDVQVWAVNAEGPGPCPTRARAAQTARRTFPAQRRSGRWTRTPWGL